MTFKSCFISSVLLALKFENLPKKITADAPRTRRFKTAFSSMNSIFRLHLDSKSFFKEFSFSHRRIPFSHNYNRFYGNLRHFITIKSFSARNCRIWNNDTHLRLSFPTWEMESIRIFLRRKWSQYEWHSDSSNKDHVIFILSMGFWNIIVRFLLPFEIRFHSTSSCYFSCLIIYLRS